MPYSSVKDDGGDDAVGGGGGGGGRHIRYKYIFVYVGSAFRLRILLLVYCYSQICCIPMNADVALQSPVSLTLLFKMLDGFLPLLPLMIPLG